MLKLKSLLASTLEVIGLVFGEDVLKIIVIHKLRGYAAKTEGREKTFLNDTANGLEKLWFDKQTV